MPASPSVLTERPELAERNRLAAPARLAYHWVRAHDPARALPAAGEVPWWPPERRRVTLQQILAHMCVETARHAGHADILRELLDGAMGQRPNDPNVPQRSTQEWADYRARIEAAAQEAGRRERDAHA